MIPQKQLVAVVLVLVAAAAGSYKFADAASGFIGLAIVCVVALLAAGAGGGGVSVQGLAEGARRAGHGERPSPPPGSPREVEAVYEELGRIADRRRKELADLSSRQGDITNSERTLEEV